MVNYKSCQAMYDNACPIPDIECPSCGAPIVPSDCYVRCDECDWSLDMEEDNDGS